MAETSNDETDWAADGQKRVENGSDGLWLRFGAQPDDSIKSLLFTFRFNPCVSLFAMIILFSLVGFCAIPPGKYCSEAHYIWPEGTTTFNAVEGTKPYDPRFEHLSALMVNDKLTMVDLSASGKVTRKFEKQNGVWVSLTVAEAPLDIRVQGKDCFMPGIEFSGWMEWVTDNFCSFYIITQDIWIVFVAYLAFSKYGNIKLGKTDDEPDFTYFQWFAMLFTAGVATGLFFFAATEPQYYYLASKSFNGHGDATANKGYSERNRFTYTGVAEIDGAEVGVFNTPNARVQDAMTLTWYHWGLHGWVCYCVVGLLLAFLHFRKDLPMTIKTCFYPLVGTRIYGFAGDLVDTISVVATTMGVCTSLGMGMMQLNYGLEYLNGGQHWMGLGYYNSYNVAEWNSKFGDLKQYWESWPEQTRGSWYTADGSVDVSVASKVATIEAQNNQQALLIWVVTGVATLSVLAGLKNGIARLAVLCLVMGQFLLFYIWMMDDTFFLMNFFVQSLGDYMMRLPGLGFYASAVEQSEVNNAYGEYSSWQFWWTIFYWGWWIAWAPMVGVFLARLGKGRTVREFIFTTMVSAVLYNFLFMCIIGGASLKMQLLAEKFGVGMSSCTWDDVPIVEKDGEMYRQHPYKQNVCREVSHGKYSSEGEKFCSTITNMACSLKTDSSAPLFDIVGQYGETGAFMVTLTLVCLTIYFICSSDSGSLVDDMICANGIAEPSLIQRFVWAMTEGIAATALLSVGKYVGTVDGGLKALRACSIAVGLPYTFLICIMCVSLWRALQLEMGERKWGDGFKSSIFDIGVTIYQCGEGTQRVVNLEKGKVEIAKLKKVALAFICPAVPLVSIAKKVNAKKGGTDTDGKKRMGKALVAVFFFYLWLILLCVDFAPTRDEPQVWGSIVGNETGKDGNRRYMLSSRYGYYHAWKGESFNEGDAITLPNNANTLAGEVGNVGDHWSKSRRIAAMGWFMFFCIFCVYLVELRSEVRGTYAIQGSLFEDWLCSLFWPMCLDQMDEKLDEEINVKSVVA